MTIDEHLEPVTGTVKESAWGDDDSRRQIAELAREQSGDITLSPRLGSLYHPPNLDEIPRDNTYINLLLEEDQLGIWDGNILVLTHVAPEGLTRTQQAAYRLYRTEGAPSLLAIELALKDG